MAEQAPGNQEQLRRVLELSERFLEGAEPRPGQSYRPIHIKLGWLLGRAQALGGYEPDPIHAIGGGSDWWFYVGDRDNPVRARVKELYRTGLQRWRSAHYPVGGWGGHFSLTELAPAQLVERKVVPTDGEKIYDLKVHQYSSDGHGPDSEYERIIYSPAEGVLEHAVPDWLKNKLAELGEDDPLARATSYLSEVADNQEGK